MNFKKLTGGITTSFNRAVQFTEEKLGQTDRTEYDPEFESLLRLADQSEKSAERMAKAMEAVIQPNPAYRVEDLVCDKLDTGRRDRTSPLEELGNAMVSAGNEMAACDQADAANNEAESALLLQSADSTGPASLVAAAASLTFGAATSDYARALVLVGEAELQISQLERNFAVACSRAFAQPLRAHLAGDARALAKERRALENFRLDLDSARSRLRRCRDEAARRAAESECDKMEAEFEHQMQVTRLMLEGVSATHDHHLNCLIDLIEAQTQHHSECLNQLSELRKQLKSDQSPF